MIFELRDYLNKVANAFDTIEPTPSMSNTLVKTKFHLSKGADIASKN